MSLRLFEKIEKKMCEKIRMLKYIQLTKCYNRLLFLIS